MTEKERTSLEERLHDWRTRLDPDPGLGLRVLRRIRQTGRVEPVQAHLLNRFRFVAYGALAALVLIGVFLASRQLERHRLLRDGSYCLLIDPVFRAQNNFSKAESGVSGEESESYLDRLAWMQDRLDLSREQFMDLVGLHRQYADRFDGLYRELVQLDREYGHFEDLRRHDEAIDFMALYDVLQEKREAEATSHSLSREFIGQVLAILDARQRPVYLSMVHNVNSNRNG